MKVLVISSKADDPDLFFLLFNKQNVIKLQKNIIL